MRAELDEISSKSGLSMSDLIRLAVEEYVTKAKKDQALHIPLSLQERPLLRVAEDHPEYVTGKKKDRK
jgi:metal-responsive CopG/Arc/MetJ family transcriptional regulator